MIFLDQMVRTPWDPTISTDADIQMTTTIFSAKVTNSFLFSTKVMSKHCRCYPRNKILPVANTPSEVTLKLGVTTVRIFYGSFLEKGFKWLTLLPYSRLVFAPAPGVFVLSFSWSFIPSSATLSSAQPPRPCRLPLWFDGSFSCPVVPTGAHNIYLPRRVGYSRATGKQDIQTSSPSFHRPRHSWRHTFTPRQCTLFVPESEPDLFQIRPLPVVRKTTPRLKWKNPGKYPTGRGFALCELLPLISLGRVLPNSWSMLPFELLVQIFSHLSIQDLCSCACTCPLWMLASRDTVCCGPMAEQSRT